MGLKINMNKKRILSLLIFFLLSLTGWEQNITRPNIMGPGPVRVNSYTGNMFLQRTDLHLSGRMPIDISFSYNTADYRVNQGYGYGWTFNYGMELIEQNDSVKVIRNDGRKDLFTPGSGNLLVSPRGIFDSLKRLSPGVYQLRARDGTKYLFENPSHMRLTRMEDRNGNSLIFSYTDGLISTIADGAGRSIQLTYTNGKLSGLTEANGSPTRAFAFSYDNTGNLLKVTDAMGFTIEYGYLINGPINVIQDKNKNVIDVIYDENFVVKEVISCLTKLDVTYSTNTHTTHVTELVGNTDQLTSYKFDASGNLAQKTGNCCGYNVKYEYDQDKNVSKLTDANGNITSFTYDGR